MNKITHNSLKKPSTPKVPGFIIKSPEFQLTYLVIKHCFLFIDSVDFKQIYVSGNESSILLIKFHAAGRGASTSGRGAMLKLISIAILLKINGGFHQLRKIYWGG